MNRFALLLAVLPLSALAQEGESPALKVAVVPFAPLSGDVPNRAGIKAAGLLATELKNTDGVEIVDLKRGVTDDPFKDTLDRARKGVEDAKDQRKKHKFRLAEEALTRAIADYKAGAAGLADVGELADAYALLSAVQYNTGRDEEGQKSLVQALALAPDRDLPLAATSAQFGRVVAEARKGLAAQPKGSLLVESTPSGAQVTVDGIALGASPLQVRDVPPGMHVWKVSLPSGDVTGGVVDVGAGKSAKVAGQAVAKDAETKMLSTLSQNKVDNDVVAQAKQQAADAGADALVFGGVVREGKDLALDAFIYAVSTGELRRLPRLNFDAELLSAGTAFMAVAASVKSDGPTKVGKPVKLPATVTEEHLSGAKVAEAKYGVQPNKEAVIDVENAPDTVTPKDQPKEEKRRVPLKKK